jgi:DNA-binding CsgD family transcriptional regulator
MAEAIARPLLGDGPDEPAAWVAAAAAWQETGWLDRVATCRLHEAEARLASGESRRAAEIPLREARDIATRVGAAPLLAEIEALARRARIELEGVPAQALEPSPAVAAPADPHGLTERERELLGLLVEGRTNREIGEVLFISPKTAGVHVSNILGKLGAANRVEAASIAHRLHLLG